MHKEAAIREPLILGHKTYHDITEDICRPIEDKAPRMWYILFTIAAIIRRKQKTPTGIDRLSYT